MIIKIRKTAALIAFTSMLSHASYSTAQTDFAGLLDMAAISVVSGYKQERTKAPAVVRVIDKDEILREGHLTLGDVLRRLPGIHISPSADATATVLSSRGNTTRMLLLFDGVETPTGSVNSFGSVDTIPLLNVEYIEVMRGPNSSVYGADALLGTINIVTTAEAGEESSVGVVAGENGLVGAHGSYISSFAGKRFSLTASHYTTDGFSPVIERDRQTLADQLFGVSTSLAPGRANEEQTVSDLRVVYQATDSLKLRAHYYQQKVGAGAGFAQALDAEGGTDFDALTSSVDYQAELADWSVQASAIYYVTQADGDGVLFPAGSFLGAFPDGVRQTRLNAREKRAKLELSAVREFDQHKIRVGLNYLDSRWTNLDDARNFIISPRVPFPIPIPQNTDFVGTPQAFFGDLDYTLSSAFVSDEWNISDDLTLAAGVRFDDHSTAGSSTNPRVSLIWNQSLSSTYKLLYGEAFRPPSATQLSSNGFFIALGNRNLKPATLRNIEFVADNKLSDNLSSQLSVFTYSLGDSIVAVPNASSANGLGFDNIEQTIKGKGLEWALDWRPLDRISIQPSVAYTDSRDSSSVGESKRLIPEMLTKLEVNVSLRNNWDLSFFAEHVADRKRSASDTRDEVEDYTTLDVSLFKPDLFGSSFDASLRIRNLFDEDAREPISNGVFDDYPVAGRAIQLRLQQSF